MKVLEFLASIFPWLVVCVVALVFRRPINGLIERVTSIKGPGGFEAAAEAGARAVAAVANAVADTTSGSSLGQDPASTSFEHLWKLAETNPQSAVLQGYETVELTLRHILGAPEVGSDRSCLPTAAVREAAGKGLVEESSIAAVDGLAVLRDLAAHGGAGSVTTQKANEFLSLAFATNYALTHPRRS